MSVLSAGATDCSTGLSQRIYAQLTGDARNGFVASPTAAQSGMIQALCYAAAKGVVDEILADFKVTHVLDNVAGPSVSAPVTASVQVYGGTLLALFSGSGFTTVGAGVLTHELWLNSVKRASAQVYAAATSTNYCFPGGQAVVTALAAGTYTLEIRPGTNTQQTINNFFHATVIEFPF